MTRATEMFDRSLLPPAQLEFVVVADTHYMVDVGDAPLEFESRRVQGVRAGAAWTAIGALEPEFVVHMGDLIQEFPGRPDYERAIREALAQIDAAGLSNRCRFVAGNHDIGDKPDPTMPTRSVTAAELQAWHNRHGVSWGSWEAGGIRFMRLNSQILNTDLAEASEQKAWFETCLADLGDRAGVLFIHLPPYLSDPWEPHLGHYDNIGEPARTWLLDLVRNHRVVALFAAHVHFQFYDHVQGSSEPCRFRVTPSTSFTRPGFSHLFRSAAPPEQGRDDVDKLGFFCCRVPRDGDRVDVHRVRMSTLSGRDDGEVLLTPPSAAGRAPEGFGLGVTLRHPLAAMTEVPIAWPSVIRQPVRNDYPLLSCIDLGARWVRVPVADLRDPVQSRRLELMRRDGVGLQAVALGAEEALQCEEHLARADRLEVQIPGQLAPDADALRRLSSCCLPLVFSPVLPGESVAGKQHKRTRIGYRPDELDEVAASLEDAKVSATLTCRIDGDNPWSAVEALAASRAGLQLLCELPGVDDAANVAAVTRAVVAAACLDVPLFLEPLVDMDRTMDVANGLLDTFCNPRPAFDAARCLGALLTVHARPRESLQVDSTSGCEVVVCGAATLIIPGPVAVAVADLIGRSESLRVCRLSAGLATDLDPRCLARRDDGPLLIYPASPR